MVVHSPETCSIPYSHVGACEIRGTGGWVEWENVPHDPWNEVIPGLWIGGSLRDVPTLRDFDHVITLWRRASPASYGVDERVCAFPDTDVPPIEMLDRLAASIEHHRLNLGERVLVRCQLGLNRSALVIAHTMTTKYDISPAEAISYLRIVRSPYVLCNPNFESWLMNHE